MPNITKPTSMSQIWSSTGTKTQPADSKIAQGWVVELPPYQTANFIENRQDQFNAHANQHGVPVWDATTEYQGGHSYTKGSNGKVYKCVSTNTNVDPTNPLNSNVWSEAFEPFGSVAIVAADLAALQTNYNTLSGITNLALARANLAVFSKSESDLRFAALNGNSANVFSIAPAVLPEHAVRRDQIDALVTQATEVKMGVAAIATHAEVAAGTNDTDFVTPLKGKTAYLMRSNNLSDLTNTATARTNLGLGSAATHGVGSFLQTANNLSDLASTAVARSNLGLGSAAVRAEGFFLQAGLNFSDVVNVSLARTNLGLGNSATRNVGTTVNTVAAGDDSRIVNAVQTSRRVHAGNGMVGGGALGGDITLHMGAPGTLNAWTGNSATPGTHHHAIDINSWFGDRAAGVHGWYVLPGGFIFMWGHHGMNGGADAQVVSFPRQLSQVFNIQLTNQEDAPWESAGTARVTWYNGDGFGFRNSNTNTYTTYFWYVVGML